MNARSRRVLHQSSRLRARQVRLAQIGLLLAGAVGTACVAGCAVGQPPGKGKVQHLKEPTAGAGYYLYRPEGYETRDRQADHRYPLVMTFHGMKPFDSAGAQIREWQQEADRYGYVVCAPQLSVPTTTSPLPLDRVTSALKRDEQAILAIMDEIGRTVDVDRAAVLATSWSYGGYVAHYMANRHPERFTCLAVKQSNFNADILDESQVPRYRETPVAVFYTQNDFAICQRESQAAGAWYARRGFDVTFAEFGYLGHERTPGPAAAFFARTCGAKPKSPPWEIAFLQVTDPVTLDRVRSAPANLEGKTAGSVPADRLVHGMPPPVVGASSATGRQTDGGAHDRGPTHTNGSDDEGAAGVGGRSDASPGSSGRRSDPASLVRIRLNKLIDVSPVLVTYRAIVPESIHEGAAYMWILDGEPISSAVDGQKLISPPGDHKLEVLITDSAGRTYRASETVTVLERLGGDGR